MGSSHISQTYSHVGCHSTFCDSRHGVQVIVGFTRRDMGMDGMFHTHGPASLFGNSEVAVWWYSRLYQLRNSSPCANPVS